MLFHYVILIFYNFLMGGQNRTNAATIWTDLTEVNATKLNQNVSSAVATTKTVNGGSVTIFRNHKSRPHHREVISEKDKSEWSDLASNHLQMMTSDSVRCATPRPKVIQVQEIHRDASKRFVPSCVTLHRCDHGTGCCDNEDHVCTAIRRRKVPMYFFVIELQANVNDADPVTTGLQAEKLYFTNHTECGCRKRKIRSTLAPPIDRALSGTATNQISFYLCALTFTSLIANKFIIS